MAIAVLVTVLVARSAGSRPALEVSIIGVGLDAAHDYLARAATLVTATTSL